MSSIVGTGNMAQEVIQAVKKNPESGHQIIGCLEIRERNVEIGTTVSEDIKVIGSIVHFQSQFYDNVIDELIFAIGSLHEIDNITDIIGFAEELDDVQRNNSSKLALI